MTKNNRLQLQKSKNQFYFLQYDFNLIILYPDLIKTKKTHPHETHNLPFVNISRNHNDGKYTAIAGWTTDDEI